MTINNKTITPKEAFNNGYACFSKKDYKNARYWYNISSRDSMYRNLSLAMLIQMDIKEGNYVQARDILESCDTKDPLLKRTYGLLERVEFNFEQSRKYYSECMKEPKYQYEAFFALAKLHVQMGDYDIGKKMFQTLQLKPKYYFRATLELIYIFVLQRKFYEAEQCLMTINTFSLSSQELKAYILVDAHLKYYLGQLKSTDKNQFSSNYRINYLYYHNDANLLNHIERHKNLNRPKAITCFYPNVDLAKLLREVRCMIENMNGSHFEYSDIYKFRWNSPIGLSNGVDVNDLCVITILGTKDIFTMYPIILSKDYNKEGLLTSEELKLKRILGGKR